MGARDNVLFYGVAASGSAAGTVVPLSLSYGIENVRQGYGTPKLKSIQAFTMGGGSNYSDTTPVQIEIKNSNWIDAAGLTAMRMSAPTAFDKDGTAYLPGRDKVLAPNTSWTITGTLSYATNGSLDIFVLLEIEYSDVPGVDAEKLAGAPVMKKCTNASVTGSINTYVSIGSFDNLLQGVTYVLSEASIITNANGAVNQFLVLEGFSNQRGLTRIIPIRNSGTVPQIEGSVYLTKQTYNVGLIVVSTLSSTPVTIALEMIASTN